MKIITARDQVQLLAAWEKTAEPTEFTYLLDPHEPHDWQEHPMWTRKEINDEINQRHQIIPPAQYDLLEHDWHPSVGETHVRYEVQPGFQDSQDGSPTGWYAHHYGLYQGLHPVRLEDEEHMWPKYRKDSHSFAIKAPDGGEEFSSPEEAKAAAEEHFSTTYGGGQHKPGPDYYDKIMNNLPEEDYGDFGGMFGDKT